MHFFRVGKSTASEQQEALGGPPHTFDPKLAQLGKTMLEDLDDSEDEEDSEGGELRLKEVKELTDSNRTNSTRSREPSFTESTARSTSTESYIKGKRQLRTGQRQLGLGVLLAPSLLLLFPFSPMYLGVGTYNVIKGSITRKKALSEKEADKGGGIRVKDFDNLNDVYNAFNKRIDNLKKPSEKLNLLQAQASSHSEEPNSKAFEKNIKELVKAFNREIKQQARNELEEAYTADKKQRKTNKHQQKEELRAKKQERKAAKEQKKPNSTAKKRIRVRSKVEEGPPKTERGESERKGTTERKGGVESERKGSVTERKRAISEPNQSAERKHKHLTSDTLRTLRADKKLKTAQHRQRPTSTEIG